MIPKEKKIEASTTKMLAWATKLFPLHMSETHGHAARRKRASDLWAAHHAIEGKKPVANLKEKLRRARVDKHARSKRRKGSFAKTAKKLGITNKKKDLPKVAWSRDDGTADDERYEYNKSWRETYATEDVERALAFARLVGWSHEVWEDGDIQFVAPDMDNGMGVLFADLAKLFVTFTPVKMVVQALVEEIGGDPKLYVTMSWNEV